MTNLTRDQMLSLATALQKKEREESRMNSNQREQAERRRVMKDTRHDWMKPHEPSSYSDHAQGFVEENRGGRYVGQSKPTIVGQEAAAQYPSQPPDAWSMQGHAVPPEAPFGVDLNWVEPCGTAAEVEQSLKRKSDEEA